MSDDQKQLSLLSEDKIGSSIKEGKSDGLYYKELFNGKIAGEFIGTYTTSDLSPGMYILNIQNEKGFKQERIIVQ